MFTPTTSWPQTWGEKYLSAEDLTWLKQQLEAIKISPAFYFSTFSLCARRFDQEHVIDFGESAASESAHSERPYQPSNWSSCTLARAILIMSANIHWSTFDSTFTTADLKENIDLYKLLHLFNDGHHSSELRTRLGEGLRTNTVPIFKACAFDSNLPATLLPEDAWNQMILKALFLDLDPTSIVEQTRRTNDRLDVMLLRYASEKAHASREIPPCLWELMQPELSQITAEQIKTLICEHPNPIYTNILNSRFTSP